MPNYALIRNIFTLKITIDIHLAISNSSINVTEENACEDTESWCILTSQFECNDDRISQKCPKTCTNECLSTIEPTCEDTEPWCVFIGKFECKDNLVKEKCSNACHQCNGKYLFAAMDFN